MGALQTLLRGPRIWLARRDNRRGIKHWKRGDLAAAQAALRRATRRHPAYASALSNLGMVLIERRQFDEGLALLKRAVEVDPRHAGALNNLGVAMILGNNPAAAVTQLQAAVAADPTLAEAHANLLGPLMEICAWPALERKLKEVLALAEGAPVETWAERVRPFDLMALPVPRELQRAAGRYHGAKLARSANEGRAAHVPAPPAADRLRVAYVSSDFRNHATTHLCVGLFGRHDRARFEVTAYAFGSNDGSSYRKRIEADCEHFFDISALSLDETVQRIADDGIHVLVDMKGYCGGGRPEIFARRAAPIQVSYLGYPNSMHAPFMDYLVGDRVVIPEADADWYSEAVAWLPGTYQINDCDQAIDARVPTRAEQGLPEHGFVYCCFNNSYKIEPRIFACWMRILKAVPDAVLWLYRSNVPAKYALWKAAEGHGVARRRIVFATSLPKPQHLARLRLADLVLDTHYYNAHTTTTDALWAGVPVLTRPGEMFASRVAASLLTAVGLPDLITASEEEYERRAIALASDAPALAALRARLAANRRSTPLFDTDAHVRHLESAFETMWATHLRGERPQSFLVAAR
jgi:protein O-GlcNAc transferase